MWRRGFPGGTHPHYHKDLSSGKAIEELAAPEEAVIPLHQHTGAPSEPIVKVGDRVRVGTKIGEAAGAISVPTHSSIAGEVKKIEPRPHPLGANILSVVIANDGSDEEEEKAVLKPAAEQTREEMIGAIKEAGIVGLGGAAFPTFFKLSPPKDYPVDTVILNGAECEPYLTADHRLMLEHAEEIVQGGKIIMKVLDARQGFIAIEENKPDAIALMEKLVAGGNGFRVAEMPERYPQGAEKQLIKALLRREVPCGGLPFHVGTLVQNVGTALAIYEAVTEGRPLTRRVATVTGSAVAEPKNLMVRIGTPVAQLIEACGGYRGEVGKLIVGGPMMGLAQFTDEVPVIKGTSGILVLTEEEAVVPDPEPCIRCARCVDTCPMRLVPCTIQDYVEYGLLDEATDWGLMDCIECGCCAFVCPARRRLVGFFKYGKALVMERRKKSAAS
ncbi:electron transporter RnfC [candidate division TA06 bacterium DG_24]|uniref:Ion-translocating oxidoreductase complex subunit C n=3 Tax=Bacteria division TA06 TaxID=1156500 RepID=A0A0S8JPK9_UNCT6|nr:MAG: electron transporter RnfC [candidate division TA06 bacterium DG_24]KPK71514.1 MAG: electron transporter RnfC [candidate division TA06 bacterium SM23_40]KPL11631.1 MAG: electron transporter RnfC [candidate division TA06 bacterium SM1_40]